MSQQPEEPYLPAYTLRRRQRTRREMARSSGKRLVGGALIGGAPGVALGVAARSPRKAKQWGATGATIGALAGAATPARTVYESTQVHGVYARPTAPGKKPTVSVVRKADKRHGAEAVAGAAGVGLAANAGRLNYEYSRLPRKVANVRIQIDAHRHPLPAPAKVPRTGGSRTKGAARREALAPVKAAKKARAGRINAINRAAKTWPKPLGNPRRRALMAVGYVGGGLAAWHGSRQLVDKANRRDVDRAAAGGAAGAGGYQLAMYATKPIQRKVTTGTVRVTEDNKPGSGAKRVLAENQARAGLPARGKKMVGDPGWLKHYRSYPKQLPGARFYRTMSHLHGGKSGVALTAATGAAAAAGAVGHGRREIRKDTNGWTEDPTGVMPVPKVGVAPSLEELRAKAKIYRTGSTPKKLARQQQAEAATLMPVAKALDPHATSVIFKAYELVDKASPFERTQWSKKVHIHQGNLDYAQAHANPPAAGKTRIHALRDSPLHASLARPIQTDFGDPVRAGRFVLSRPAVRRGKQSGLPVPWKEKRIGAGLDTRFSAATLMKSYDPLDPMATREVFSKSSRMRPLP